MIDFFYSIDLEILYFFNHSLSLPLLDRFFGTITNVNNWYLAYIILLSISFFKGGIKGKLAVAGVIILIIITDQLSHNVIKELIQRERPCNALKNVITPLGCGGTFSFPSNHAFNNFAAAAFFFILYPNLKWPLFISAFLVSVSRIYLGLHYPSDVLAGIILGVLFGFLIAKIVFIINQKLIYRKTKFLLPADQKLIIRESTEKDIPIILNFIKELAGYEKLSTEVIADEKNLKKTLFGKNKYAEVLIAEYDNLPAGQALFFHNYSTFKGKPGIYLEDLYVKPQFRGKGIGKALLLELINIAKKRNCGRVEWAVLDWNKPAIDFYEKLGAIPMNDWKIYRLNEDKF
jgi:membrane-associated phospholipid phosphatase/GNAT superfamily N-acetyltransferase